jgi:hypothetical protein
MIIEYQCAVCGETNETVLDESAGLQQQFIEDCQVCCRPNVIRVLIDEETGALQVESTFEE